MARQALARKYFLIRFPWLWSKENIFLEITLAGAPGVKHALSGSPGCATSRRGQYFGISGSIRSDHASTPPTRFFTF